MILRRAALLTFTAFSLWATDDPTTAVLNSHISADNLRANLSFLASDAMQGRATPSPFLDVAAEFIASRFRLAGLEPLGPHGSYFQEAHYRDVRPTTSDLFVSLAFDGHEVKVGPEAATVRALAAFDLKDAALTLLPVKGDLPDIKGKIVAGETETWGTEAGLVRLQAAKPQAIVLIGRRAGRSAAYLEDADAPSAPVIRIGNAQAHEALALGKGISLSVHAAAPESKAVAMRNVVGVLKGSDPSLRNEYVLLSAHYDHVGTRTGGGDDKVYNGANDNASGTVSVIEIAQALAALPRHPKRSIIFIALFGEERGLLGAYYWARHPLAPLAQTVAAINLEQMGRTDDKEGPRVKSMSFTGAGFSDLPDTMAQAAKDVTVYKQSDADAFFDRSDNYAFALQGVVAHTLVVAYEFPGYHAVDDEWQKIDYANMAFVDRGVAQGLLRLADQPGRPAWKAIKETEPYRHPAGGGKLP